MELVKKRFLVDKKQLRVAFILLFLGITLGFLFYIKIDSTSIIEQIKNIDSYLKETPINFILVHILTLFFLMSVSFSFVGIFLFALYFIWEFACITYACFIFANVFGLMGFLYGIIYNIVIKLLFLILLVIIFKKIYFFLKNKNNKDLSLILKKKKLEIIFCLITIFVYDIILYFIGNEILLKFIFIVQ